LSGAAVDMRISVWARAAGAASKVAKAAAAAKASFFMAISWVLAGK
jgi:hypothetical protein